LLTEGALQELLNGLENLKDSKGIKGIRKSTARLQRAMYLEPGIGKLLIAPEHVGEKIFARLAQLSQMPFEGEDNPWDIPMAIYMWILGKRKSFRYLLPGAIAKIKQCKGCPWAKERADLWSKLGGHRGSGADV
jgi:hypothetical protein